MSAEAREDDSGPSRGVLALLQWLLLGAVLIAALTIVGVHAPAVVKKIGLFAIGYGLLVGWGLGYAARLTGWRTSRSVSGVLAFVVIAAGLVGLAFESYRQRSAAVQEWLRENPETMLAARMVEQGATPDDPRQRSRHQELQKTIRRRIDPGFFDYLAFRLQLSPLRTWPMPWPAVFWIAEVLLGGTAGAWLTVRTMRSME